MGVLDPPKHTLNECRLIETLVSESYWTEPYARIA